MSCGVVYFKDGHTEEILGCVKSERSGIYEIHTDSGIYYMHPYIHTMPSGYKSTRYKYFKETADGSFIYAQISRVTLL